MSDHKRPNSQSSKEFVSQKPIQISPSIKITERSKEKLIIKEFTTSSKKLQWQNGNKTPQSKRTGVNSLAEIITEGVRLETPQQSYTQRITPRKWL